MSKNNVNTQTNIGMIAFFFDSGKIENSWYGASVYNAFLEGQEISNNSRRVIISLGDIVDRRIYSDIAPFIIHDELCSIERGPNEIKSAVYVLLVEDIYNSIAIEIDQRLKNSFSAYMGMTSVNPKSEDSRKQFWKFLIRHHSIEKNVITCFSKEEVGDFNYNEVAIKHNFTVKYDEFYCFQRCDKDGNIIPSRRSSFINLANDTELIDGKNESDRGLIEMNRALVRETEIAGILIWRAVEDINRAYISKNTESFNNIGHIFTSIYQASQGIERLLKIILTVIKYRSASQNEKIKLDELLLSHSHIGMCNFIEKKEKKFLNKNTRKLLELLSDFYSDCRYHRYTYANDNTLELRFLNKFASDVTEENYDELVKNIYGKILGELAHDLYLFIKDLSQRTNTSIYELPYASPAIRVFLDSEKNLYKLLKQKEQSKKELLWYLIKRGNNLPLSKILEDIAPLDFEETDVPDYIESMLKDNEYTNMLYDYVAHKYKELIDTDKESWKMREEGIGLIGKNSIIFQ